MELTVTVEARGASAVAHLSGELDAYTAPQLRTVLLDLARQGQSDVVVHLKDVTFVDSTGLGVLVGGLNRQRNAGRTLRLAAIDDRTMKVFRITGLDSVFEIHPDLEGAVAAGEGVVGS